MTGVGQCLLSIPPCHATAQERTSLKCCPYDPRFEYEIYFACSIHGSPTEANIQQLSVVTIIVVSYLDHSIK